MPYKKILKLFIMLAQFDDRHLEESLGWHLFGKSDFEVNDANMLD